MLACRLETGMMSGADLDGALVRGINVMPVDATVTLSGCFTEEEGDDAFAVSRKLSPPLTVVDSSLHVGSRTKWYRRR